MAAPAYFTHRHSPDNIHCPQQLMEALLPSVKLVSDSAMDDLVIIHATVEKQQRNCRVGGIHRQVAPPSPRQQQSRKSTSGNSVPQFKSFNKKERSLAIVAVSP
ncbi:hypothetical protein QC763_0004010 [Podospora pseudopauciseta]|uniref:Uncharacterized protein n=2 Tax=Podospora TaxID=5144 RepID=A0ABR0HWE6_9PEZI|nr:hypothetical protein QC763_0004010 [Podospora pseudopauciseta]